MSLARNWVRIRSWHVLDRVDKTGWHTLCGRSAAESDPVSDALPLDEKSCETCLRLTTDFGAIEAAYASERDPEDGSAA